ncbi:MAG: hypothetical protein ACK6AD_07350 [Cyanobacteriota bacterium]
MGRTRAVGRFKLRGCRKSGGLIVHSWVGLRYLLGEVADQPTQIRNGLDQKCPFIAGQTTGSGNDLAAPDKVDRSSGIRNIKGPWNQKVKVALS